MGNEQDVFARLRQPFGDDVIKWKVQTNPKENDTFALCVAYIDARDVSARLNEIVGIAWDSAFSDIITFSDGKKVELGVECRLTVLGHTRVDIGTLPTNEPLKGGYSDALKRAAVHFGIAAYVYAFPKVWAEVKQAGRSYYFTDNAKRELMELVACIHAGAPKLPTFRALKVRDYAPINFALPYYGGVDETTEEAPSDELSTICADCGYPIANYETPQGKMVGAPAVVKRNLEKYGRALCMNCAGKQDLLPRLDELDKALIWLSVSHSTYQEEWSADELKRWGTSAKAALNKRLEQLSEQSGVALADSLTLPEQVKQGLEMMEVVTRAEMVDEAQR